MKKLVAMLVAIVMLITVGFMGCDKTPKGTDPVKDWYTAEEQVAIAKAAMIGTNKKESSTATLSVATLGNEQGDNDQGNKPKPKTEKALAEQVEELLVGVEDEDNGIIGFAEYLWSVVSFLTYAVINEVGTAALGNVYALDLIFENWGEEGNKNPLYLLSLPFPSTFKFVGADFETNKVICEFEGEKTYFITATYKSATDYKYELYAVDDNSVSLWTYDKKTSTIIYLFENKDTDYGFVMAGKNNKAHDSTDEQDDFSKTVISLLNVELTDTTEKSKSVETKNIARIMTRGTATIGMTFDYNNRI